jgi:hypothetical protein
MQQTEIFMMHCGEVLITRYCVISNSEMILMCYRENERNVLCLFSYAEYLKDVVEQMYT